MVRITCVEVDRLMQDARSNLPRCGQLKRRRDVVQISLLVASQRQAEECFLVSERRIERGLSTPVASVRSA